jgi:hypothetical protein
MGIMAVAPAHDGASTTGADLSIRGTTRATMTGPTLAVHADWSVDPRKRWMTQVARTNDGVWRMALPCPVGELASLGARLAEAARGGAVALGVDFPLGLPRLYAALHAEQPDFPAFLRHLADRPDFFRVCAELDELAPARPFYPARGVAGMTRAAHGLALGLGGAAGLSRACDRATRERPAGAPLFWTLGANQTGKAAITAWRDFLLPALDSLRLWPFDGNLGALLAQGGVTVAETYPAEALRHLGLAIRGSKRRHSDRAALAPALKSAMDRLGVRAGPGVQAAMRDGFGDDAAGEDRFDSVLGALCVVNVLAGNRPDGIPEDPWLRRWEGWVLGQTALPLSGPPDPGCFFGA